MQCQCGTVKPDDGDSDGNAMQPQMVTTAASTEANGAAAPISLMPMNAGQMPMDAGHNPMNAGQMPMNAGQMPMDVGQTPMNAGPIQTSVHNVYPPPSYNNYSIVTPQPNHSGIDSNDSRGYGP